MLRFAFAAGVIALAACSGPTATPAVSRADTRALPAGMERAPARRTDAPSGAFPGRVRHVFLADSALNKITIFDNGGTRSLGGFEEPQGLTTDRSGTLYVANTELYEAEEFQKPYDGKPLRVLQTAPDYPVDIAVSKAGVVAVLTICGGTGYNCYRPGSVYFYANTHATSPCAVISGNSKISRLLWGAFDAAGTLYVTGENDYTTARIGQITGGCAASSLEILKPNVTLTFPGGIQVDRQGRIALVDSHGFSGPPYLDVFLPPKKHSRVLAIDTQASLSDSMIVVSFALSHDGTTLYTAEPHDSIEYPYPHAGFSIGQIAPPGGGDVIEGVAVTPAEIP